MLYGISQASHPEIPLRGEQCLAYAAGMPADVWSIDADDAIDVLVPPGLYAVFTHDGPLSHMIDTVNYAWASWLPQSQYDKSMRPDIEVVPWGALATDAPHIELWIAIEPKA